MTDYEKSLRDDLRRRTRQVSYQYGNATIAGTLTVEAIHLDMPMPVGIVWYSLFGMDGIQILNSFVDERYRRCGVRTYLHEKLLSGYPTRSIIISGGGTKSGQAWMKATGYKQTKAGWEYRRK